MFKDGIRLMIHLSLVEPDFIQDGCATNMAVHIREKVSNVTSRHMPYTVIDSGFCKLPSILKQYEIM